jgi:hypothetical protein
MNTARHVLACLVMATTSGAALAQTTSAADAGAPPPPQIQSGGNGIQYFNGGAGEEARAAIAAQSAGFPLRVVFSVAGGAYAVADHVELSGAGGKLLGVDGAGPMLVVKLPPGEYSLDVSYQGKSERRPVRVGRDPVTLNWRLSGDTQR